MTDLVTTKSFTLATYRQGDPSAKKLALLLPGKLDTKDYAHMRSHVDFLAKRGFLAIAFDPPGTWESSGSLSLYTMTNYIKAVNELIEYFGDRPTLVMGHSRGSSVATLVAAENQYVVALVSMMCSAVPGSLKTKGDDAGWRKRGYFVEMRDPPPGGGPKTKRFELPYSFFEDQQQYDLEVGLKAMSKPKLFIPGPQYPSRKAVGCMAFSVSACP